MLRTKRVYDALQAEDGVRVLVDRLWPRGMRSGDPRVNEWIRDIAPSHELRKWFHHELEKWPEFQRRYREELSAPEKEEVLAALARRARREDVTLVYASRETEHNNARVLQELINRAMEKTA